MKIVATDNYARETVSERLIAENVKAEAAEAMCESLNKTRDANVWYVVKPDEYILYVFDPT